MYKIKQIPLTISGVLKEAWYCYKSVLLYLLPWSFIIAIIHVISYLFGYMGIYHYSHGRLTFSWDGVLAFVALLVIESYFLVTLFYTLQQLTVDQALNFARLFQRSRTQFINLYLALISYFLIVNIGIFVFILPGLFLAVALAMFLPLIVVEEQSIYPAFVNSVKLVWGYWWQTFFVLMIPYLLSYLARSMIITSSGRQWIYVVDVISLTLIAPYFYSVILIQYHNLKYLKSLPQLSSQGPRRAQS